MTEDGLAVSGELDLAAASDFRKLAASNVDPTREFVLNIADLTFLDSSGIRAIIGLAAFDSPHGLVLRWPRDNVQRALDIVKIEDLAEIRVERRSP